MDTELDELISKYSTDLINLRKKWTDLGITPPEEDLKKTEETDEAVVDPPPEPEITEDDQGIAEPPPEEQSSEDYVEDYPDTAVKSDEEQENLSPTSEIPLADPDNFAFFSAGVYSGNQAYAIPRAKISIYLDGKLHAFLITDENGATEKIKLQSYPKLNTFIPESNEQTVDYSADVFAEGFTEKKGLLVSAVGGSDILLNVELTPLSERID